MNATAHPFTPEEIMAFLDGELPADRAQSISAHSESCPSCHGLMQEIQQTKNAFNSWPVPTLPSTVENRIQTALAKSASLRPSPAFTISRRFNSWSMKQWILALALTSAAAILVLGIAIPNLLRSRMAANEASSVGSLRALSSAAEVYAQSYGHYPRSLKNLGPSPDGRPSENAAGLIDPALASGAKSGYSFSYRLGPGPDSRGGYTIDATPLQAGSTGQRRFSTDQTGVLSADNVPVDRFTRSVDFARTNQLPVTNEQSKLTALNTPGVAADSNGLFHGLDHAQNSFSVDGQPIVDQQSRVFPNPMIARTVSLAVVSKDFDAAHKSLEAILARHNGYAASLNVSTPQGAAKSIEASLRVPAPQLPATLTELRALGRVENEGQNGEEVTQQHADLVARLKNSRETELRLQDILVHHTGKISDVLSVEQEIARVRGEIEQMEAEQKNLEHRVDFATVDFKLSEEYKAQLNTPAPSVSTLLRNALIDGLRTAADSVLSLVLFFSESGPVVLLWLAILAIPARQLWRRYRRAAAAI